MYQLVEAEDTITVAPLKFSMEAEKAIKDSISEKFQGKIDNDFGIYLSVVSIEDVGEGKILPGDPSVHYPTKFTMLTWMPREHEVVEGEIVDITEWGAFVRIGPVDALTHISQVMDDFVSFDEKNAQLVGRASKRILKVGDKVRARIISISLKEQSKVGLTMRQPFLGNLKWVEEKAKEEKKEEKQAEKKEKKKEGK
ncbi:MAG: DNA-directed RNA polymerase [Candidatus Aenigmarchaeota archaeon]|nr:DNA-directed RNA polymerase [Candidatus Aenigmarchaeota archaeon]